MGSNVFKSSQIAAGRTRPHSGPYIRGQPINYLPSPEVCAQNTAKVIVTTLGHLTSNSTQLEPNPGCTVSVSTTFYAGAHNAKTDTIFVSSDSVLFYVHCPAILVHSKSAFESFLSAPLSHPRFRGEIIPIPESSPVLNIILHVIYNLSPPTHGPSFDTLVAAITRMPCYGLTPKSYITSASQIHDLLLSHAPRHPFELYTFAAQFDLSDIAVPTSTYLLSYPLTNLSDEMAVRMGPIYLKRLFALHNDRFNALKIIVLNPPHPHPVSKSCGFDEQCRLARAWALVSAYLVWEGGPGWCY